MTNTEVEERIAGVFHRLFEPHSSKLDQLIRNTETIMATQADVLTAISGISDQVTTVSGQVTELATIAGQTDTQPILYALAPVSAGLTTLSDTLTTAGAPVPAPPTPPAAS